MLSTGNIILIAVGVVICATGLFLLARRIWHRSHDARRAPEASTPPAPLRSAIVNPQAGRSDTGTGSDTAQGQTVTTGPAAPEHETEEEAELEDNDPTAAELIAEGDEHMRIFDYDAAIESYEGAQDPVTEEFGRDSIEFADLLVKTEDAYFARDNEDSIDNLNCNNYLRALSILERNLGAFDVRLLPVLNRISAFYLLVNKPSEAESMVRRQQRIEVREQARKAQEKRDAIPAPASTASTQDAGIVPTIPVAPVATGSDAPTPVTTASTSASAPEVSAHAEVKKHLFAGLDSGHKDIDESAAEGDKALAEYDYDSAVDHYNEAFEAAKTAFGRDSVRLVPVLARLVSAFHARDIMELDDEGDSYSDPIDHARLALAILVKDRGANDVRLLPALTDMVAFSDLFGDHYKADTYLAMIERVENAARSAR